MDTNWSRIWLDLKITVLFLTLTVSLGLSFVLIQSVGPRAPAFLWSLAALACGGLVGFLFGIPRVLQDKGEVGSSNPNGETASHAGPCPTYRIQVNTNLEQISDWLTKIIVGIGLIELRNVPEYLNRLSLFIGSGFGNTPQSQVLSIALILYFSIVGFLGGYLMTRIYLAQAFSRADWGAQNTVIVAGRELTLAEVSEQSRKFLGDLQDQILNLQKAHPGAHKARTLDEAAGAGTTHNIQSILWVDDNPKNNSFLVERLNKLGIKVTAAVSTTNALSELKHGSFDRIISDMGRHETTGYNQTAGLDLLRAVRELGIQTPLAIYCSSRAVATYGDEALELGANAVTSSPTSLLQALKIDVYDPGDQR